MAAPPTIVGGRYRLGALIAASGMADVYTANDERLDRPVALKFLRATGPTDEPRFRREMATLARLEHPNLVRLYDADVQDTTPYLVLELVDGPSLAERLAAHGPIDADDAARLLRDLASALAYIHERDVVHRDVKPANVLLDPDGRARLTDFGIARVGDATAMTGTAMTIGTAAYLAPEQARGDQVTAAADVYALGLVVLECLTGERAFPGSPVESAVARLTRDPEIPAALDDEWRQLLGSMTSRDPDARPTAASIAASFATAGTAGAAGPTATVPMGAAGAAGPTATVPMGAAGAAGPTATVPMGAAGAAGPTATVPMGAAGAAGPTATVPMGADGAGATELLPADPIDADRSSGRRWRVVPVVAALVLLALVALGLSGVLGTDDPLVDAQRSPGTTAASIAPTTAPTSTAPTSTAPPTTAPRTTAAPTTAAPAVVAANRCATLEAQRKALDDQKKNGGGKGEGNADDKAERDAQRKALDELKKQADAALKACQAG